MTVIDNVAEEELIICYLHQYTVVVIYVHNKEKKKRKKTYLQGLKEWLNFPSQ